MVKVIIKCFSNSNLLSKYHIIIFNKNNRKVAETITKYQIAELYLAKDVYRLLIIPLNIYLSSLSTSFIVKDETNFFNFYLFDNNSSKITAILVDANYNNLPIERGEIILWQDHIQ